LQPIAETPKAWAPPAGYVPKKSQPAQVKQPEIEAAKPSSPAEAKEEAEDVGHIDGPEVKDPKILETPAVAGFRKAVAKAQEVKDAKAAGAKRKEEQTSSLTSGPRTEDKMKIDQVQASAPAAQRSAASKTLPEAQLRALAEKWVYDGFEPKSRRASEASSAPAPQPVQVSAPAARPSAASEKREPSAEELRALAEKWGYEASLVDARASKPASISTCIRLGALRVVTFSPVLPGSAALLDHALACPVCGESVGRTPALCCAQCTCGPFHPACALPGGKTSRCPQCAQPAAVRFTGAVTPAAAGPRESVILAGARGATAEEAEAASGSGASGAGGAGAGTGSSGASAASAASSGPTATRRGSRPTMRRSRGKREAGGEGGGRGSGRAHRRGGARSASGCVRYSYTCKDCGGASICEHNCIRSTCKDCGGTCICEHNRRRGQCKDCGSASICEHNRIRSQCKDCGGASICEHNRVRYTCKDCGGAGICDHIRERRHCRVCGGKGMCAHSRVRSK
jgi:hypothetical protein